MAPVTIAANGLLKEITRRAPRTIEELREVPEIRDWQLEAYGEELVQLVNEVLAEPTPAASGDAPKKRRRRRRKTEAG